MLKKEDKGSLQKEICVLHAYRVFHLKMINRKWLYRKSIAFLTSYSSPAQRLNRERFGFSELDSKLCQDAFDDF